MKSKRVLRHYCDYCGKSRANKQASIAHENRCIYNPMRTCQTCTERGWPTPGIVRLTEALNEGGIEGLRIAAEGCPSCMMAAVVADRKEFEKDPYSDWREYRIQFDYKTEQERFFSSESHPEIEF